MLTWIITNDPSWLHTFSLHSRQTRQDVTQLFVDDRTNCFLIGFQAYSTEGKQYLVLQACQKPTYALGNNGEFIAIILINGCEVPTKYSCLCPQVITDSGLGEVSFFFF